MNKKDPFNDFWVEWCARILAATLLSVLVWVMCSCRTQYIPVESVRYDSIYFAKLQKDSIYIQDSIYIKDKGDTVFVDKFKYIYKYVNLHDTCFIERTDSILVPYPVERELTAWQKVDSFIGDICITCVLVFIIYLLLRWMVRKSRKE